MRRRGRRRVRWCVRRRGRRHAYDRRNERDRAEWDALVGLGGKQQFNQTESEEFETSAFRLPPSAFPFPGTDMWEGNETPKQTLKKEAKTPSAIASAYNEDGVPYVT